MTNHPFHRRPVRSLPLRLIALTAMATLYTAAAASGGETVVVHRKTGGKIEGTLLHQTPAYVELETRFGRQKIRRTLIAKIVKGRTAGGTFRQRREQVDDTDGRALIDLARWAESEGLAREARNTYEEAMEVAGPHYPEALFRFGVLAMKAKDYRQAALSFLDLAQRLKNQPALVALKRAEEMLREDRLGFWRRGEEALAAGRYPEAIAAYRQALFRAVYDEPRTAGEIARQQIEEKLLASRLAYHDALAKAWQIPPREDEDNLPERARQALDDIAGTASLAAKTSWVAPQIAAIGRRVALLGHLLPYSWTPAYDESAQLLRGALPEALFLGEKAPPTLVSLWSNGSIETRQHFLQEYAIELAAATQSPMTSFDRSPPTRTSSRIENLRRDAPSVTFRDLRVEPERYGGEWVALPAVYGGEGPAEPRGTTFRLNEEGHRDFGVVAYNREQRPVHHFLRQRSRQGTETLEMLLDEYPYGAVKETVASVIEGSQIILYGRVRVREETVPLHLLEVWSLRVVDDPVAVALAERLRAPLRCAFEETPLPSVISFFRMVTRVPITFGEGAPPDIPITLTVRGAPAVDVVEKIAEACAMEWTREGEGLLMKKKLTDDEVARRKQILRLIAGEE